MAAYATAAGAEQMPLSGVFAAIAGKGRPRMAETPGEYRSETPAEAAGGDQHARIPDAVLCCTALPVGARLLYGLLQRHMGRDGCFPSVRRLAAELGVSARSVETWLAALIESGAVVIDVAGGGRRSNRYGLTGTARSVAMAATKEKTPDAPRSVANPATQRSKSCYAPMQNLPQIHSHVAKANLAKDPAPTERRAAPAPEASKRPEKRTSTAKDAASTVEANPTEREHGAAPAKRAAVARHGPDATPAGYELMAWWCRETNNVLAGDDRRRFALGGDDLLRKTGGDAAEAQAYLRFRIGRGASFDLRYVPRDYTPGWRKATKAAGGQRLTPADHQDILDSLLAEAERDDERDDQGAEDPFRLWPEQRAEDRRGQGPGGGGMARVIQGVPVRVVGLARRVD